MRLRDRSSWMACVVAVAVCTLSGCGGGPGNDQPETGIVSLFNQTDQGMAPKTVTSFIMQPEGGAPTGELLNEPLLPGAVVILGPFATGTYDATAVLDDAVNLNFKQDVFNGLPTTFVVPP